VSTSHDDASGQFSYREYLDLRGKTRSYAGVIASTPPRSLGFSAGPGATPRVKVGMLVSGNYFRVLGVEPRLGRGFRRTRTGCPAATPWRSSGPTSGRTSSAAPPASSAGRSA
jgi:hypothetical protein